MSDVTNEFLPGDNTDLLNRIELNTASHAQISLLLSLPVSVCLFLIVFVSVPCTRSCRVPYVAQQIHCLPVCVWLFVGLWLCYLCQIHCLPVCVWLFVGLWLCYLCQIHCLPVCVWLFVGLRLCYLCVSVTQFLCCRLCLCLGIAISLTLTLMIQDSGPFSHRTMFRFSKTDTDCPR